MFDDSTAAATTPSEPLSLEWIFGLQRDVKKGVIHNLSPNDDERIVFYTVANTGVIYNATNHTQRLLRGHRHTIVASACSADRRYLVTAERDNDEDETDDSENENENEGDEDHDDDGEYEDGGKKEEEEGNGKEVVSGGGKRSASLASKRGGSNSRSRRSGKGAAAGGDGGKRGRQRRKKKGLLRWNRQGHEDPLLLQQRGQSWKMGNGNGVGEEEGETGESTLPTNTNNWENEWDAFGDALMIVWDVAQGLPVSTIPISRYGGVCCLDMSADGAYLVTVSNSAPQQIALWNWTAHGAAADATSTILSPSPSSLLLKPILLRSIPAKDKQTVVRFNPEDPHVVLTNGALRIIFWSWAAAAAAASASADGVTGEAASSADGTKQKAKGIKGAQQQQQQEGEEEDWGESGDAATGGRLQWKYYSPPIPTIHSVFSKNAAAAAATAAGAGANTTAAGGGLNQSKSGKMNASKNGLSSTSQQQHQQKQQASVNPVAGVPAVGRLTQSIFVPGTSLACSGTADGEVVLWGVQSSDRLVKSHDKTLLKQVRVNSTGSSGGGGNGTAGSKSNASSSSCAVTCLTFAKGYIVVGSADGCVRFFDCKLRLVSWFEELNGGPITSISFDMHAEALLAAGVGNGGADDRSSSSAFSTRAGSVVDPSGSAHKSWSSSKNKKKQSASEAAGEAARMSFASSAALGLRAQPNAQEVAVQQVAMRTCTDAAMGFEAPDFMVSTAHALIINVFATSFHSTNLAQRRGLLLVQGQDDAILALASHAAYPWLAIAGASGSLHLWDYTMKRVLMLRHFPGLQVQCMAFEQQLSKQQQQQNKSQSRSRGGNGAARKRNRRPLGRLAVGFTNGLVKILDVATSEDIFSVRVSSTFTTNTSSSSSSLPVGILSICFSGDGQYIAVSDSENCVGVLQHLPPYGKKNKKYPHGVGNASSRRNQQQQQQQRQLSSTHKKNLASRGSIIAGRGGVIENGGEGENDVYVEEEDELKEEWIYIGRHRAHQGRIVGLQFMPVSPPSSSSSSSAAAANVSIMSESSSSCYNNNTSTALADYSTLGVERLISLGEDKRLVEYNTIESTEESGLLVLCAHNISQEAVPSGFFWSACPQLLDADSTPSTNLLSTEGTAGSSSANASIPPGTPPSSSSSSFPLDLLGIASSGYKLKLYCSDWKRQCVKTVLGPTFGGPMSALQVVSVKREEGEEEGGTENNNNTSKNRFLFSGCLAYASRESVIGLLPLPLDGDPTGAFGVYAHPRQISSTAISSDGQFMFTAGGSDQSVMQWRIDVDTLHDKQQDGRPKLQHYIDAIEGGPDGELLREVVDYFYYAQIRAQGEETTAKRKIHGAIPFSQMPDLCRALGFYPSQVDIRHLTFEVMTTFANRRRRRQERIRENKGKNKTTQKKENKDEKGESESESEEQENNVNNNNTTKMDLDGDENDDGEVLLSFEEFLRFYINHRPVLTVTNEQIERAFAALAGMNNTSSSSSSSNYTGGGGNVELNRDALFEALSSRGEAMHSLEVVAALRSLLGDDVQLDMLEDTISARAFAENLLGFEPTTTTIASATAATTAAASM